jgi:hypothetical protein
MRNGGDGTHDLSLFSDLEDTRENGHLATYALTDAANRTTPTLAQSNSVTQRGPIACSTRWNSLSKGRSSTEEDSHAHGAFQRRNNHRL